jgi:hypothetical protein
MRQYADMLDAPSVQTCSGASQWYMMENALTSAGECVQVAAAWQTVDPAASAGTSGSLGTAFGTNKALADAQKQLHISQQQARTFLHMASIGA